MSKQPEAPTYKSGKASVAPTNAGSPEHARAAALEFLGRLAAEVSGGTVDLPCFPNVVVQIRDELSDPKTTPERMVMIVGAEPRLTAKLLQTANSAAFNTTGKHITDLKAALLRLGHQLVQGAAMSFAVQQMKSEKSLRSIAKPLGELWAQSIAVASICHVMARRSKLSADEAFLTGLLHGIGRMYIMVRSAEKSTELGDYESFLDLVSGWHASIGQAVLENWGLAAGVCEAVGAQDEVGRERKRHQDADLTDILMAAVVLAQIIKLPIPRTIQVEGTALEATGLSAKDCDVILQHAEYQLASLQDTLGC
jgi:HD-like signal output (HDOD) protein